MKTIVPGIHDFAPPEGRLTFELFDERMRRIHKTHALNNITNQFKEAMATGYRGQPVNNSSTPTQFIGFDSMEGGYITNTDNVFTSVGAAYPHIYARHYQFCNAMYLSSSPAAVNDNWWFPLGLEAGANLGSNNVFTDNKKRGNRVPAMYEKRPNLLRYVIDFPLNMANGFSVESAGLAGLRFPNTDGYDGVWGWWTISALSCYGVPVGGGHRVHSHASVPGQPAKYWIIGEEGSWLYDLLLSTNWASTAVRALQGPTLATWGSPSPTNMGISIIGTDFWMMDTTRLRKFAIPTSTTLPTLNGTYSPVTGFTDAACLGLCTDGTNLYALGSTKVFVISPSTGAVTSSWTHNANTPMGMTYDDKQDVLWIICSGSVSYPTDGFLSAGTAAPAALYAGDYTHAAGGQYRGPMPWSKTGTPLGFGMQPNYWGGNPDMDHFQLLDGCRILTTQNNLSNVTAQVQPVQSGGVLGTRAIVAAPFVKTNSQVLRVTYDISYAPL